jgi:septal ring factor EnvC (AmiA/AmiB activator)
MNTEPDRPGCLEGDVTAIQQLEEQLCEAEQELKAAGDIIAEQEVTIECQRLQLETADQMLDEASEACRRLERRIADLEDDLADEPCPVPVVQEERRSGAVALTFKPVPPATLKATPTDLAALEDLVGRLG